MIFLDNSLVNCFALFLDRFFCRFWIIFRSFLDRSSVVFVLFLDRFQIVFGSFLCRFCVEGQNVAKFKKAIVQNKNFEKTLYLVTLLQVLNSCSTDSTVYPVFIYLSFKLFHLQCYLNYSQDKSVKTTENSSNMTISRLSYVFFLENIPSIAYLIICLRKKERQYKFCTVVSSLILIVIL